MTQLIKIILILLCIAIPAKGQDLFNEVNTFKFAEFLFKTQQYNLAAQEYERLVFLVPSNESYKLSLFQSYRFAGDYPSAQKRFSFFFGDSLLNIDQALGSEYIKVSILQDNISEAQHFIKFNTKLDNNLKLNYQTCIYILESRWCQADSLIKNTTVIDPRFAKLTNDALHIKYKKPFLAASFAAILPGSGKAYCGYWKDGLISLLFVSANAWQTYRGFTKYGPTKPHGWIFGGLTAGFYFGNIYGSWKAAKKHNKKADDKIHNESKNIIFSTF